MKTLLIILFTSNCFALEISPAAYQLNTGSVKFLAVGRPSALKIRGEGDAPTGKVFVSTKKIASGSVEFQLESLKTGIGMRDTHMKEKYLQTKDYPKAELILTNLDVSGSKEWKDADFVGRLKLHGREQEVKGKLSLEKTGDGLNLKASFPLKLGDYGIDVPKYMGITVAEDVEVEVESKVASTK